MARVWTITDWDKHYENSRSRSVQDARWCPIPNRFDGERITELIAEGGDGVYGAWCATLLVASRCTPRGVLLRSTGSPHTPGTLQRMTGISREAFDKMLQLAEKLGLMAPKSAEGMQLTGDYRPGDSGLLQNGRNGMEGIEPPNPPAGGEDAFESFWTAYPKHQRKVGKSKCLRYWSRNGLDEIAVKVIEGVQRWANSEEWTKDGGAFICQPHRWLNEQRWQLEVTPAKSSKAKADQWESLGPERHAQLLREVQEDEPSVDHRLGNIDTQRAMRKRARDRGWL